MRTLKKAGEIDFFLPLYYSTLLVAHSSICAYLYRFKIVGIVLLISISLQMDIPQPLLPLFHPAHSRNKRLLNVRYFAGIDGQDITSIGK